MADPVLDAAEPKVVDTARWGARLLAAAPLLPLAARLPRLKRDICNDGQLNILQFFELMKLNFIVTTMQ